MNPQIRIGIAEAIGTLILILGGPGTAILATGGFFGDGSVGVLGVAIAFGLALLTAAYAIGAISGCHVNPAVTFGLWLAGRTTSAELPWYVGGQIVGAFAGGLILFIVTGTIDGFDANDSTFAVNGWDDLSPGGFNFGAMAIMEVLMTGLLVFVVLSTTRSGYHPQMIGVHVGLTLALIHLISIPIDNTSVNPVRSFAVAIFAGGDAIKQLWAFILFPLIGAALGWASHQVLADDQPTVPTEF